MARDSLHLYDDYKGNDGFMQHKKLILAIARYPNKYKLPNVCDPEERAQAIFTGVARYWDRYDPSKGAPTTFIWQIARTALRNLRLDYSTSGRSHAYERVFSSRIKIKHTASNLESIITSGNFNPNDLAKSYGITVKRLDELLNNNPIYVAIAHMIANKYNYRFKQVIELMGGFGKNFSLDYGLGSGSQFKMNYTGKLKDYITDSEEMTAEEYTYRKQTLEILRGGLEAARKEITSRKKAEKTVKLSLAVLRERFEKPYVHGEEATSITGLAKKLSVSRQRIDQIEKYVIQVLKQYL